MRLALLLVAALPALAASEPSVAELQGVETETARRIQAGILDPILGAGRSSVLVRLALEVKTSVEDSERSGTGSATKVLAEKPDAGAQRQESRQIRGVRTERRELAVRLKDLQLTILHDERLPSRKLDQVRDALTAAYDVKPRAVSFKPTPFEPRSWWW